MLCLLATLISVWLRGLTRHASSLPRCPSALRLLQAEVRYLVSTRWPVLCFHGRVCRLRVISVGGRPAAHSGVRARVRKREREREAACGRDARKRDVRRGGFASLSRKVRKEWRRSSLCFALLCRAGQAETYGCEKCPSLVALALGSNRACDPRCPPVAGLYRRNRTGHSKTARTRIPSFAPNSHVRRTSRLHRNDRSPLSEI
ncbi:hypothetical protein C8Q70DRAFT_692558 [Cubamyces menziesii]|nr:hypothetical protein C8Q70DRAFT_692558 [Cubamyces menziesii]